MLLSPNDSARLPVCRSLTTSSENDISSQAPHLYLIVWEKRFKQLSQTYAELTDIDLDASLAMAIQIS
jgi:hypothetical protein